MGGAGKEPGRGERPYPLVAEVHLVVGQKQSEAKEGLNWDCAS